MRAQPLANLRIAITRYASSVEPFAARIEELGATALICPAISIAPLADTSALDAALLELDSFDWLVVTSANTVTQLMRAMDRLELAVPPSLAVAAVGPATAAALRAAGWRVELVPEQSVAEELLAALGDVGGQRILLPQADIARPVLAEGLRAAGAAVTTLAVYHTVADPRVSALVAALQAHEVDIVLFSSASTARLTWAALSEQASPALLAGVAIASIGPVTSAAIRELGGVVAIEASPHTMDGLLEAIMAWNQARGRRPGNDEQL